MLPNDSVAAILLRQRLPLTAFFVTVARNHHLAEDVFQDVCVKAISHSPGFDSQAHLLNWARQVGRNRAIDLLRARDGKYEGLSGEVLDALADAWPQQREDAAGSQQEILAHCLQSLTPNNRQILQLRYLEGRSGAEVAQILGRKLETVYQSLARIHRSLRQCVERRLAGMEAV